ncbi:prominin-1-A-like isoform X3 [Anneissia japonica]|uniref:prominin-1-A-like isoform X3 n=1 Tax=Anneissia japonica TaxID=1529436 RepID=UPI00142560B1|nr:prominin-1-A-like isoform X3 [Anneissia japonica]
MTTSTQTTSAFSICFLLILSSQVSSSEEQCNPVLNDDGTIDWPSSCALPPHTPASGFEEAEKLEDKRPLGLIDMANGFVDFVQRKGLPYEKIRELEEDDFDINIKELSLELSVHYIGIIICFCIGILSIIIIPWVGFCFCCCRCCNNCGGKRIQKETKSMGCKRIIFSILLLSITIVIGFGMAYSNTGNDFLTKDSWDRTKLSYQLTLDEADAYSATVSSQINYTLEEYRVFDKEMRLQIDGRGNQIYALTEPYLLDQCGVQALYDSYENFTGAINDSLETLVTMETLQADIISETAALGTELSDIQNDLESVQSKCRPDCDSIDLTVLELQSNITQLPDLSNEISNVTKVLEEVEQYEEEAKDTLESVPEDINNSTQETVDDFYKELDNVDSTLADAVQEVNKVNKEISEYVDDARISKDDINQMDEYVDYVKYGFIGITCTILLIVMFNIGGMAMGTFTYKQGSPMDRSKCSNAGGNVLMCGVFFSFVFFWFLMLIVSVLFLVFSVSYQVCEPLQTKDIFKETIDQPGFLCDGDTGSWLGDVIYGNQSYNITVTGILESCAKNESAYKALQLHYVFDLDDIQKEIDDLNEEVNKLIDEVDWDTSDFELVTDELMDSVNQIIADSSLAEFNISEYEEILNQTLTNDLVTFANSLNQTADNLTDPTLKNELYHISYEIILVDEQAKATEVKMNDLLQEAETLQVQITAIQDTGSKTIKAANYTENQIKKDSTQDAVKNSTKEYAAKLIRYTESYVNHLTMEIEDELAPCGSISNLYDLFVGTLCDFNIDAWNTIWFTLGWSIFFFIPSIIFAVKLAKYYRIMKDEYIAVPKPKKKKKNKKQRDVESPEEDEMGADSIQLMENSRRGATNKDVTPYANPHYRHDSPILGYNDLGDRGVPPPAYNYGGRRPMSAVYPSHYGHPPPRPQPKPKRYSDMYEHNYQTEDYM